MKEAIYAIAALFLSGCISLTSSRAPPIMYTLHADMMPKEYAVKNVTGVLFILDPSLPAGFETDQIALFMDDGRRLDYYSDAKWASSLNKVIQGMLVQMGQYRLQGVIVGMPDLNIPAQYKLATNVNKFAPVYHGGPDELPQLIVSATFTLIKMPEETVVADFTLKSEQKANLNSVSSIVNGLEALLQGIIKQAYINIDYLMSENLNSME